MPEISLEQSREMLLMAAEVVDREGDEYRPILAYAETVYASKLAKLDRAKQSETDRIRALIAEAEEAK